MRARHEHEALDEEYFSLSLVSRSPRNMAIAPLGSCRLVTYLPCRAYEVVGREADRKIGICFHVPELQGDSVQLQNPWYGPDEYCYLSHFENSSTSSMWCGRRGGLMVSVLDSGSSGPGSGPGRRHCVVFLGKTLYSHGASLHSGV